MSEPPRKIEPLFRSDALRGFHELLSQIAAFEPIYRRIFRVELVIDASMVQRELRWRLRGREKPDARSAMQEAIDAGTLVIFAPTWLSCEIDEHIKDIAADTKVSEQRVLEEWRKFAQQVRFYEPEISNTKKYADCADPDDLPYKLVRHQLGADGVYTADTHFDAMGEARVNIKIDLLCRDYARAASVELGITLGSGFTLLVSLEILSALAQICIRSFKRLPPLAKVGLVSIAVFVIAHPVSRKKALDALRSVAFWFKEPTSPLRGILGEFARQFLTAHQNATKSAAAIKAILPPHRRRSAIVLARSICLVHKAPLLLEEIERRMRIEGYVSRSPHFKRYLRSLLRADQRFREVSPGLWTLQTVLVPLNS